MQRTIAYVSLPSKTVDYPHDSQGHSLSTCYSLDAFEDTEETVVGDYGDYGEKDIMTTKSAAQRLLEAEKLLRDIKTAFEQGEDVDDELSDDEDSDDEDFNDASTIKPSPWKMPGLVFLPDASKKHLELPPIVETPPIEDMQSLDDVLKMIEVDEAILSREYDPFDMFDGVIVFEDDVEEFNDFSRRFLDRSGRFHYEWYDEQHIYHHAYIGLDDEFHHDCEYHGIAVCCEEPVKEETSVYFEDTPKAETFEDEVEEDDDADEETPRPRSVATFKDIQADLPQELSVQVSAARLSLQAILDKDNEGRLSSQQSRLVRCFKSLFACD
jgi:hypothetical protein